MRNAGVRLGALLLVACTSTALPTLRLDSVSPAELWRGSAVTLTLHGSGFWVRAEASYERDADTNLDDRFVVVVGGREQPRARRVSEARLEVELARDLPVGVHDVRVTDPNGRTATLVAALRVRAPSVAVSIETRADGSGAAVGTGTGWAGKPFELFAVGRTGDGAFAGELEARWRVEQGSAVLSASTGTRVVVEPRAGSVRIGADAGDFGGAATGVIQINLCAGDGDCADACYSAATCVAGACALSAVDKDSDGDGWVDDLCVAGDDCDDDPAGCGSACNVSLEEDLQGGLCDDGYDNDCDGRLDADDPGCGWLRRVPVLADLPVGSAVLNDVPVLVRLDAARIDYALTGNSGEDVRFMDGARRRILAHEVERWSAGGDSAIWVRVPVLDAATSAALIWMYYGNSGVTGGGAGTAVWEGVYAGVWHLSDDLAGVQALRDSTAAARHGDGLGTLSPATSTPGLAGHALGLDGVDDQVSIPGWATDALPSMTIEAWIRPFAPGRDDVLCKATTLVAGNIIACLGVDALDAVAAFHTDGPGGVPLSVVAPDALYLDDWNYLVATWDAGTQLMVLYVNGVVAASSTLGGGSFKDSPAPLVIGNAFVGAPRNFNGMVDEVRVSERALGADWVAAQYRSVRDILLVFGGEEVLP